MEQTVDLREHNELWCPHCGGGRLEVTGILFKHSRDGMVVGLDTNPLTVDVVDGVGGRQNWIVLTVYCRKCSPKGDQFHLVFKAGLTRFATGDGDDAFTARGLWRAEKPTEEKEPAEETPEERRRRAILAERSAARRRPSHDHRRH